VSPPFAQALPQIAGEVEATLKLVRGEMHIDRWWKAGLQIDQVVSQDFAEERRSRTVVGHP
jgi:hypothetical protein